jgi:hypothetical protein
VRGLDVPPGAGVMEKAAPGRFRPALPDIPREPAQRVDRRTPILAGHEVVGDDTAQPAQNIGNIGAEAQQRQDVVDHGEAAPHDEDRVIRGDA